MALLSNQYVTMFAEVVFILGYLLAFFIDHIPWSLRVTGNLVGQFPLSTLRSTQILMVNRFGAAFCFTAAGFLVDAGIGVNRFFLLFSIAWGLLGALTLIYILHWPKVFTLLSVHLLGVAATKNQVAKIEFSFGYVWINYPVVFNLLGAAIPILSAAAVPEIRGLLLQLGFVFNSIASLLLVFVLEPIFMSHISANNQEEADFYHQRFIISKTLLLFVASFIGFVFYYWSI